MMQNRLDARLGSLLSNITIGVGTRSGSVCTYSAFNLEANS
jgi:hypothetical protein